MNKQITLILATLLIATTSATLYEFDLNNADHQVILSSGPLSLIVGDQVKLVVNENPTTGYKWQYDTSKNSDIFSIESDTYKQAQTNGKSLGKGGIRVFQLLTEAAGSESFEIVYVRSWEFNGFDESFNGADFPAGMYYKVDLTVSSA